MNILHGALYPSCFRTSLHALHADTLRLIHLNLTCSANSTHSSRFHLNFNPPRTHHFRTNLHASSLTHQPHLSIYLTYLTLHALPTTPQMVPYIACRRLSRPTLLTVQCALRGATALMVPLFCVGGSCWRGMGLKMEPMTHIGCWSNVSGDPCSYTSSHVGSHVSKYVGSDISNGSNNSNIYYVNT